MMSGFTIAKQASKQASKQAVVNHALLTYIKLN